MAERHEAEVIAVVQARMTSARLPGKVLRPIGAEVNLAMVLDRLARCRQLAGTVLATSTEASDDPIAEFAAARGQRVHRGPLDDVLARYLGAVEPTGAAAVVRITADCPLIDPGIVDRLVELWRGGEESYVANVIEPRTFPKGLDVEVVSVEALTAAAAEASDPADREHVTTWIRARPARFAARGLWMTPPMGGASVTLDTVADLEHLRALIARVGPNPALADLLVALGGPAAPELSERPSEPR